MRSLILCIRVNEDFMTVSEFIWTQIVHVLIFKIYLLFVDNHFLETVKLTKISPGIQILELDPSVPPLPTVLLSRVSCALSTKVKKKTLEGNFQEYTVHKVLQSA
jgi:hypothetical protein